MTKLTLAPSHQIKKQNNTKKIPENENWKMKRLKNRSSLDSVDYANAADFGAIMSHWDWVVSSATRLIVLQTNSNCYKYDYKYK